MSALHRSSRRRFPRRQPDSRLEELLSGDCDDPTWTILEDGATQQAMHCGKCLACRIKQRLGDRMILEIYRDLDSRRDRRNLASRRRAIIPALNDRRKRPVGRRTHE